MKNINFFCIEKKANNKSKVIIIILLFISAALWFYLKTSKDNSRPEPVLLIKQESKSVIFNDVPISIIKLIGIVEVGKEIYCVLQSGEIIQKAKIGDLISEENYQIKNINIKAIVLIKNSKELKIAI